MSLVARHHHGTAQVSASLFNVINQLGQPAAA
jgi:hypothetical protein